MSHCISLRLYTLLYTLNFASAVENGMFLTKGKRMRKNKYFLAPQWTRTVIVRSLWVSTIRNVHIHSASILYNFFLVQIFRGFTIVFSFKRRQTIQWTPFSSKRKMDKVIQVIKLESIILAIENRKFCSLWLCLLTSVYVVRIA